MKKLVRRIIPLVVTIVMCLCMAVPVFAASATVPETMRSFPKQETGNNNGYVAGIAVL